MSNEQLEAPCKQQRFKGVENFLRRIAFNLGNTPSQTEVKIISCIPIDVTDLQQKIVNLERQLHETKVQAMPQFVHPVKKKTNSPTSNVSEELDGTTVAKPTTTVSDCNIDPIESETPQKSLPRCCQCLTVQNKSNISYAFPAFSTQNAAASCRHFASAENSNSLNSNLISNESYRSIFKKRKKRKIFKDKKAKTQLVYYTQTPNHPFNNDILPNNNGNLYKNRDGLSNTYLVDIFRKHHDPKLIIKEYSDTSHFSKPVCRDTDPNWKQPYSNTSDVCSCCHGRFQNLDNYLNKLITIEPNKTCPQNMFSKKSDLCDMIPVKETSKTYKKDVYKPNYDNYLNIKCWPEKIRTRYRHNPFIVNYELEVPIKTRDNENDKNSVFKNVNPRNSNIKRSKVIKNDHLTSDDTSKNCCIDCGDIYKKPIKSAPAKTYFCKSVETDGIELNVQLVTPKNLTDSSVVDYSKTEATLNQIKDILQSVLTEVKTNSNIHNATEKKDKKDAMIQKGTSQNCMHGASTLLHSYTYNNSYNGNPYLASCSRQMQPGQYCYTGQPCEHGKYLNNVPVFIQSAPGRHMCACYYRPSAHKPTNRKRAASAATNTEKDLKESNSKETEKLIKEIYKSITLNMDFPNKDNSTSEYDDLKSSDNNSFTFDTKELLNRNIQATEVASMTKKDKKVEVLMSQLISNTTESNFVITPLSQSVSQNTRLESKDQSIDTNFQTSNSFNKLADNNDEINEDSDESISSDESDYTIIPDENDKIHKRKTGFLHKVFKSVFKKKKGTTQMQIQDNPELSDSDDYETIYSEKIKTPTQFKSTCNRDLARRKPSLNTKYRRVKRTLTPYMEQEYRRRWNKQLMFQGNQNDSSVPSKLTERYNQRPTYWQEFEARSAMITTPNYRTPKQLEQETNINAGTATGKNNLSWLKKNVRCGEHFKQLIREN